MAIPKKTIDFLEKSGMKYEIIDHRKIYTAIDKARTLKVKEKLVGKTVVIKADRLFIIALISADEILDINKVTKILDSKLERKVKKISFASEKWIRENLKGMKEGVVPPFGTIWNLPVLVNTGLLKNSKIVVNSGDHKQSIRLTSTSLKRLIPGIIEGSFSKKRPVKPKKKKK